jgi:pimeloyl-ACP methyl ester carboxylesterase
MRQATWIVLSIVLITLVACTGQATPAATQPSAEGAAPATSESADPTKAAPPEPVAESTEEAPLPTEPSIGPRPVTFTTADGLTLDGTLFGSAAPVGVILSHMYPTDQTSWHPFAQVLADQGYLALAYDFRGYGASGGSRSVPDLPTDLAAALAFMRDQGVGRVILIGASMGGMASIRVAAQDGDIAGLVVISTPRAFQGLEIADSDLAALTMPSLWLGSRNDPATIDVEAMADLAAGPDKSIWVYEGSSVHGTFIFDSANGEDLQSRLLAFIARVIGG